MIKTDSLLYLVCGLIWISCALRQMVIPKRDRLLLLLAEDYLTQKAKEPNQAPEPTPTAVTPDADASVAPSAGAAHL